MAEVKCLWCGKPFEWDESMFRFCDDCISKIESAEEIVYHLTKTRVGLCKELENYFGGKYGLP